MTNRFSDADVFVGIAGVLAFLALHFNYKKPPELLETAIVFLASAGIVSALDCGRLLLSKKENLGALQKHRRILVLGVLAFIWVAINILIKSVLAVIAYTP